MRFFRSLGSWMLLVFLFTPAFGSDETCVRCHTSDSLMKSLFVPPEAHGAEEGEG